MEALNCTLLASPTLNPCISMHFYAFLTCLQENALLTSGILRIEVSPLHRGLPLQSCVALDIALAYHLQILVACLCYAKKGPEFAKAAHSKPQTASYILYLAIEKGHVKLLRGAPGTEARCKPDVDVASRLRH